ncbi:SDR family NAD(P)-dependent oxidoreductase [Streptomyces atacamensis]|uniref:SDR family NAD(P)-dependent oxidoreductase n=1 Tax=Streptomyces atacamensis TaxID=531966 RepID=UPI00399C78D3
MVAEVEADGQEAAVTALRDTLLLAGSVQPLLERSAADGGRAAFLTVTRLDGRMGMTGAAGVQRAVLGGVPGLVKTLAIEAPSLLCRAVDLDPDLPADRCAELLLAEAHDACAGTVQVGLAADGARRTLDLAETPGDLPGEPGAPEPGPQDLLVVTGGARGVTAACAVGLARAHRPGLLLLGRTELADEPGWAEGVPESGLRAAAAAELKRAGHKPTPREVGRIARDLAGQREIRRTLAELEEAGARAEYAAVDITDPEAVARVLAPYADRVTGVVHGAGVLADTLITAKRGEDVDRVLHTKLTGLRHVLEALPAGRLRHLLLFSSVAGFFGNRGQSDYAMANEALNQLACALRRETPRARITSVNWGAWAGGMVTPELERMFAERGVPLIPLEEGVRYFTEQFGAEHGGDTVCVVGPVTPLSAPEPAGFPAGGVELHRSLEPLAGDPVLADHAIGGHPVLPATAALGAVLNAVHQVLPGTPVGRVTGFAVHKGLVLDDDRPAGLRLAVRPACTPGAWDVAIHDSEGRPRYRARAVAGAPAPAPALAGLPAPGTGRPVTAYTDGTLFHGPRLRGLTEVLDDGQRLVLACRLPERPIADGAWQAPGYSPVQTDLLLQAVLVWARLHRGQAVLPSAIGEVLRHAELPGGQTFLVVVDGVAETAGGIRCTVTACTPQGRVLLECRGVEAVHAPGLEAKFRPSSG